MAGVIRAILLSFFVQIGLLEPVLCLGNDRDECGEEISLFPMRHYLGVEQGPVYFRQILDHDRDLLDQMSGDIRSLFSDDTFSATSALLITWDGMLPHSDYYHYYCTTPSDQSCVCN